MIIKNNIIDLRNKYKNGHKFGYDAVSYCIKITRFERDNFRSLLIDEIMNIVKGSDIAFVNFLEKYKSKCQ